MKQQFIHIVECPYCCGLVKCKCISLYQLQYCNIVVCVLDYKPLLYKVLMAINVSVHHNGIMYYVVWSHIL